MDFAHEGAVWLLLEAAAAEYISKDPAWPKRTEPCDKIILSGHRGHRGTVLRDPWDPGRRFRWTEYGGWQGLRRGAQKWNVVTVPGECRRRPPGCATCPRRCGCAGAARPAWTAPPPGLAHRAPRWCRARRGSRSKRRSGGRRWRVGWRRALRLRSIARPRSR